ncbi:MAG: CRTAC1 family protein [Pseudomonadota bacterium]
MKKLILVSLVLVVASWTTLAFAETAPDIGPADVGPDVAPDAGTADIGPADVGPDVAPDSGTVPGPDWFENVTEASNLSNGTAFRIYSVDLNNDDYPELVVIKNTPDLQNNIDIYLNEKATGSSKRVFKNVTATSGANANPDPARDGRQSNSAAFADVDNDGDVDMVTCNHHHRIEDTSDYHPEDRCEVLLNNGNIVFTVKKDSGLHELGLVNAAGFSFLDYDKDGNIDLFIANYFKDYTKNVYGTDYLLKGNGDGTFTDVSKATGITAVEAPLYGVSAADWNNDGHQDIITSPYCRTNGSLWKNNGDGTFNDVAASVGYNARFMGGDKGQTLCNWASNPADFDNDGDLDFYLALIHGGNDPGEGHSSIFVNAGEAAGFKLAPEMDRITWDDPQTPHRRDHYGIWFDMDNDGWQDLAVTQCASLDTQDKLFLIHQNAQHSFDDVTAELGFTGAGRIKSPHPVNAFDYDLDGDYDVIVSLYRGDHKLLLLENKIGNKSNHISVRLLPPNGINKSAIGARVTVTAGSLVQMREVYAGQGNFANQSPFILSFGLGQGTKVDKIEVRWPGDAVENTVVTNPEINTIVDIGPGVKPISDGGAAEDATVADGGVPVGDGAVAGDGGIVDNDDGCSCNLVSSSGIGFGLMLFGLIVAMVWAQRRRRFR